MKYTDSYPFSMSWATFSPLSGRCFDDTTEHVAVEKWVYFINTSSSYMVIWWPNCHQASGSLPMKPHCEYGPSDMKRPSSPLITGPFLRTGFVEPWQRRANRSSDAISEHSEDWNRSKMHMTLDVAWYMDWGCTHDTWHSTIRVLRLQKEAPRIVGMMTLAAYGLCPSGSRCLSLANITLQLSVPRFMWTSGGEYREVCCR
jgi:hypothetical protein